MHSARVIYYAMYSSVHSAKVYSLHNIYAANIPKGVGADSSCPHHQQKQPILVCKILRITMQTMGTKYEKNNIA